MKWLILLLLLASCTTTNYYKVADCPSEDDDPALTYTTYENLVYI